MGQGRDNDSDEAETRGGGPSIAKANLRLDGLAQRVQQVLDLRRLLPDGIERARIGSLLLRAAEGILAAKVVVGGAANRRHLAGVFAARVS